MKKCYMVVVLIIILLSVSGCNIVGPSGGEGMLYIYEYGDSRSVHVKSVAFWTSSHTSYTDMDGVRHTTNAPVHYVPIKDGEVE